VGAQIVQVFLGEIASIAVDEAELMGDVTWGGRDFVLGGANVGGERYLPLEGNDVPAGDGIFSFGNGEEGSHFVDDYHRPLPLLY